MPDFRDLLVFCDFEVSSPVLAINCCQEIFMTKIFVIIGTIQYSMCHPIINPVT